MIGQLLVFALLGQNPTTSTTPPLLAAPAQPVATTHATRARVSDEQRQAELRALVEKRRARRAHGNAARAELLKQQFPQSRAANSGEVAGNNASIQALAQQNAALQAQQNALLQSLAGAQQERASIDRARFLLQTQQAGLPQIFVPGQGMVPYPYSVAAPTPTYLPFPVNVNGATSP